MKELDNIYFSKPECDITPPRRQSLGGIPSIGQEGRFQNKSDFLKQLNDLLSYTTEKGGLRK